MTLKEWYCHRESIIDSFRMQLTVFENGSWTLSCARSTEDHFICERYKGQIIPSKRKIYKCNGTVLQHSGMTTAILFSSLCINQKWVALSKPWEKDSRILPNLTIIIGKHKQYSCKESWVEICLNMFLNCHLNCTVLMRVTLWSCCFSPQISSCA